MYMNPMWPSKGNKEKHLCPSETRKLLWQGLWARPLRGVGAREQHHPANTRPPSQEMGDVEEIGGRAWAQTSVHTPPRAGRT